MRAFCAPLKCLSFLGGKKPPEPGYNMVDQGGSNSADAEDDEDDFFGDSWGADGSPSASSQNEAKPAMQGGVERNPSLETTTKRGSPPSSSPSHASDVSKTTSDPPPKKKTNDDIFGDLGMDIDYKPPRTLESARSKPAPGATKLGSSVSDLLDNSVGEDVGAGWGGDDLDFKL
eukprot:gnl/TRDRNA2_/TRDRNA2_88217_c0_seq1.p1 gnl/TRDRNA2_/TRDRNA2_88217_c0~~gnl/TRDRNA2_/TRDRNA2_88217_c0_seq1.p1  ORF type:complete len:174 (+),score=48.23 gnl/TRDRNA2_/TRDRNA2_88217_c0_seq1:74-595(+)